MKKFVPDIYQKSIYTINYSKLLSGGIKCLLFDLDNTLTAYKEKNMPKKAKDLLVILKQKGFKVIILSNSPKSKVNKYKKYFDIDGYANAAKPLSKTFRKVLNDYDYKKEEMAIIGDQLVTDIFGGNVIGITTILVNPLVQKDIIFSKVNRYIENKILKKLAQKNLFEKGRYYE